MTSFLRLEEIRTRSARIRLSDVELARLSGVDRTTIRKAKDMRLSTLEKLTQALLTEEERLRDHLAKVVNGEG